MTDHRFDWGSVRIGETLCESTALVTAAEIREFRSLLGYQDSGQDESLVAPSSMGLLWGLRLGWEHQAFPPGVVRTGDEDRFEAAVRPGDRLTTGLSVIGQFERRDRRYFRYAMRTLNQHGELVCEVIFVARLP